MESNYWTGAFGRRTSRRGLLRGAGVAGAGLAGAALIGCGGGDDPTPAPTAAPTQAAGATAAPTAVDPFANIKRGGTWNGSITSDPPTIDPYGNLSFLSKGFGAYVYSRLYKVASRADQNPFNVGVEEDAAESAETTDGQHWTVKLKPGIKYHNMAPVSGRTMTSEDVTASVARLKGDASPGKDLVTSWLDVQAVDDLTVNFTLDSPSATFLEDIGDTNRLFIMPREAFTGGFDPASTAIGSGPWMLDNYQPNVAFRFSRNPDWFNEPYPFMDSVTLAIIPEYANSFAQFQAGNLHAAGIRADDVLQLRSEQPDVQWRGLLPALLSFVYFSPEDMEPNAPWRDERFRIGVSKAQDRDELTELAGDVARLKAAGLDVADVWNNLVPAGMQRWWLDPQGPDAGPSGANFQYDPTDARALIEASGYAGETVKFQYYQYTSTFGSVGEAIVGYLGDVGVGVEIDRQDYSSVYITQTFRGNFEGIAFGYETPFPEVGGYFPRMFGNDPANHSRVTDAKITELTALQSRELDDEQRKQYIWEIQRINAEHMYYVPSQAGAATGWTSYRPEVRGISQTRGYGTATENMPGYWLDV